MKRNLPVNTMCTINYYLIEENDYLTTDDLNKKKEILKEAVKQTIIENIMALNNNVKKELINELDITELFKELANLLPDKENDEALTWLISSFISFIGGLQGYYITWYVNDNKYEEPMLQIINDKWHELNTKTGANYANIFNFIIEAYDNNLLKEKSNPTYQIQYNSSDK